MTIIGVGLSTLSDASLAAKDALNQALQSARLTSDTIGNCLLMLFMTESYDPYQVLNEIRAIVKTDNIIGSTLAGLYCDRTSAMEGIMVGIIKSDEMSFTLAAEENISHDEQKAGYNLGNKLISKIYEAGDTKFATLLLLSDGVTNKTSLLVDSLFEKLGSSIKYGGGGSGDNLKFLKTYQFINNKVLNDAVVSTLITSEKPIGIGVAHGWQPISPPLVVTNSSVNQVYELDWQNAYELYASMIQKYGKTEINTNNFPEISMRFPLGIPQSSEENYIVRDPIALKPDGTIVCVGDVPMNSIVRIMHGNKEDLASAVITATLEAFRQIGGSKPAGVLLFYCISRYLLLKDAFLEEISVINDLVGEDVPVFGCMTYGEIGSLNFGLPAFHNKSVVVCIFSK